VQFDNIVVQRMALVAARARRPTQAHRNAPGAAPRRRGDQKDVVPRDFLVFFEIALGIGRRALAERFVHADG
jgi:hypothetical protein